MTHLSNKFLAAILLSAIAIMPMRAQTNAPAENQTNSPLSATAGVQMPSTMASADSNHWGGPSRGLLPRMPMVALIGGFSLAVIICAMCHYARDRRNKRWHETLRAMIDKGVPIPPDFLGKLADSRQSRGCSRNDLRRGLILTGVGIGVIMLCGRPGWIVLFIGVAFLIASFVENRNKPDGQPPKV